MIKFPLLKSCLDVDVVDAIAREEEDKSRSLMVLEREDVLKHPTVGTDDSTASPRR